MLNSFKHSLKTFSRFNFSTLIVPEIVNNKIHSSTFNLITAAKQLDDDVNNTNIDSHITL